MIRLEKRVVAIEIDIARQSDDHVTEVRIRIIDPTTMRVCGLHQIQVGRPGHERYYKRDEIPKELLPEKEHSL